MCSARYFSQVKSTKDDEEMFSRMFQRMKNECMKPASAKYIPDTFGVIVKLLQSNYVSQKVDMKNFKVIIDKFVTNTDLTTMA
jgi:hypothetical protein